MIESYNNAFSKGTLANRARQAKLYIKFSIYYSFQPLFPSLTNLGMYARFLANSYTSPVTYKNYMSGARSWVREHGGNHNLFESVLVNTVVKGTQVVSNHVPSPAPPITQHELRLITTYIHLANPQPINIKAAILLGFACMLRSSNLLSPTITAWNGPHTLQMADIIRVPSGLNVIIKSSKTLSNKNPVTLQVALSSSPLLCPVRAWDSYVLHFKPPVCGPAFILPSGLPLTARPVVNVIRAALKAAGYNNYKSFSIHSLRRGAAHVAAHAGASIQDIKSQGTWASDAGLSFYLPTPNKVPTKLASALAFQPC